MTSQEAKNKYVHYLTVGRLKEELAKYSDDALVVAQRVEDVYYERHGWKTIDKPDPLYTDHHQQYTPVWGICHYFDDKDCLFLDLHY
jgi:hypothetical protein